MGGNILPGSFIGGNKFSLSYFIGEFSIIGESELFLSINYYIKDDLY